MKAEFWNERWEANQLGFHQTTVNECLSTWWSTLSLEPNAPVFVPLCGKSLDMVWLREIGHPVLGIEFSPIAVRDFFEEAGVQRHVSQDGPLERSTGGGYTLYCGDFFDLREEHLQDVQGVYDRAALIALPPETRMAYARHLAEILPTNVQTLLLTLEYDQTRMKGPPHSVPPEEVRRLFRKNFEVAPLWSSGPQTPTDRFRERGLDTWSESAWRLAKPPTTPPEIDSENPSSPSRNPSSEEPG